MSSGSDFKAVRLFCCSHLYLLLLLLPGTWKTSDVLFTEFCMTRWELWLHCLCTCAKFISVQVQKKTEKYAVLVLPTLHTLRRLSGPISPPVSVHVFRRTGWFGTVVEYGAERKISRHSVLSATVSIGVPQGVTLKIKYEPPRDMISHFAVCPCPSEWRSCLVACAAANTPSCICFNEAVAC